MALSESPVYVGCNGLTRSLTTTSTCHIVNQNDTLFPPFAFKGTPSLPKPTLNPPFLYVHYNVLLF